MHRVVTPRACARGGDRSVIRLVSTKIIGSAMDILLGKSVRGGGGLQTEFSTFNVIEYLYTKFSLARRYSLTLATIKYIVGSGENLSSCRSSYCCQHCPPSLSLLFLAHSLYINNHSEPMPGKIMHIGIDQNADMPFTNSKFEEVLLHSGERINAIMTGL